MSRVAGRTNEHTQMLKDAAYELAQAGKPSAFIAERLTAVYDLGVVTVRQVNRWLNERFNATRDETIANVFDDVKYLRQRASTPPKSPATTQGSWGSAIIGGASTSRRFILSCARPWLPSRSQRVGCNSSSRTWRRSSPGMQTSERGVSLSHLCKVRLRGRAPTRKTCWRRLTPSTRSTAGI